MTIGIPEPNDPVFLSRGYACLTWHGMMIPLLPNPIFSTASWYRQNTRQTSICIILLLWFFRPRNWKIWELHPTLIFQKSTFYCNIISFNARIKRWHAKRSEETANAILKPRKFNLLTNSIDYLFWNATRANTTARRAYAKRGRQRRSSPYARRLPTGKKRNNW